MLVFQLHREAAHKQYKPQFPTTSVILTLRSIILLVTYFKYATLNYHTHLFLNMT